MLFIILIWWNDERKTKDMKKDINKFAQDCKKRESIVPEEVLQNKK